jgi:hypothetical protein
MLLVCTYTDHIGLHLTANAAGGCDVEACSTSQVTSIYDASTNFCNIHDLYCSEAGCNAIAGDPGQSTTPPLLSS